MLIDARGSAAPDETWRRYLTPATWPDWAPHIAETVADAELGLGSTGRVRAPGGLALDFEVDHLDPRQRAWSWTVSRGPARVRMHHEVLPAPGGGSRATMRVDGPVGAALQPYRLLARTALRRLVDGVPDSTPEPVSTHSFAFAPSYRLPGRALGITPSTSVVEVSRHWLFVSYGPWRLVTARGNVTDTEVTGGFRWAKTVGPPHLSFTDRGVSMTPNGVTALCVRFAEPVRVLDPTGMLVHPGATLGVADPEGLAAALV